MYTNFYGFSEAPFNVTPDPRFLYLTPSHREALASMLYGIMERKGFISIIGEVGTGKTTLIHTLLAKVDERVRAVFIFHTRLGFEELLKTILSELGMPVPDRGKASLLRALNGCLIQKLSRGENVTLIIDEAQNLDKEVLEELRLLSNLETPKSKLLQIVLVGQPELDARLDLLELRQLKQRIGIRRRIEPLSPEESGKYIDHRLRQVGSGGAKVFTKDALVLVCRQSKGIPRMINTICDNALLIGYGLSKKRIDVEIVREVLRDIGELAHGPSQLGSLQPPEESEERPKKIHHEAWQWGSLQTSEEPEVNSRKTHGSSFARLVFVGLVLVAALALAFFLGGRFFSGRVREPKVLAKDAAPAAPRLPDKSPPTTAEVTPTRESVAPEPVNRPLTYPAFPAAGPPDSEKAPAIEDASSSAKEKGQVISTRRGDSIFSLARKHYRVANETLACFIMEANPEIDNIHQIRRNQEIRVPEIGEEFLIIREAGDSYRIRLGTFTTRRPPSALGEAPGLRGKKLESIPRKVALGETWYEIQAGGFGSKEECLKIIRSLKEKGLLPAFGS